MRTPSAERWEREAARYDALYEASRGRGWVARSRLAAAIELIGEGPGRVLDIGMGAGRLCAALERKGWVAYGIDQAEAMVALARERLPDASERLLLGRAEKLPFEEGRFDAVAALGSLEYTDDVRLAAREIARVLRVGGLAVVSWPNYRGAYARWRRLVLYPAVRAARKVLRSERPAPPPARNVLDRPTFLAALSEADLRPESLTYIGPRGARQNPNLGPALAAQVLVSARREPHA
jgi:SAM-dependent methyltransferase